jgi:hypothetical protein
MSMRCSLYRITPEQVPRLKEFPEAVGELLGLFGLCTQGTDRLRGGNGVLHAIRVCRRRRKGADVCNLPEDVNAKNTAPSRCAWRAPSVSFCIPNHPKD